MTDEFVLGDQDEAVDDDTEQPESGTPADDDQETAVDAFLAEDEPDMPDGGDSPGLDTPEPGQ